jgi:hypothetical protein
MVYFTNFQHIYLLSELTFCTTILVHHVLLYVVVPHGSLVRVGWDLFKWAPTSHLRLIMAYVHPINFIDPRSRDMHDANNKVVNYLFCALCQYEFNRIWLVEFGSSLRMLTLGTVRFRLGCLRLTGESTRTSLISPVSPQTRCSRGSR